MVESRRVDELEPRIPTLRAGSYVPSLLEPRRRAETALVAVVQEAYVNGVSARPAVKAFVDYLNAQRPAAGNVASPAEPE